MNKFYSLYNSLGLKAYGHYLKTYGCDLKIQASFNNNITVIFSDIKLHEPAANSLLYIIEIHYKGPTCCGVRPAGTQLYSSTAHPLSASDVKDDNIFTFFIESVGLAISSLSSMINNFNYIGR